MRIQHQILLHLTITLLLLAAASWAVTTQWNAVSEMETCFNRGKKDISAGAEFLWGHFESLNAVWKVIDAPHEAQPGGRSNRRKGNSKDGSSEPEESRTIDELLGDQAN